MTDRATFVRKQMREHWGRRAKGFAEGAARQTVKLSDLLIERVQPGVGERVLDVATGSGVLAVRAARAVGSHGTVIATDIAPEWAEFVDLETAAAGVANVSFQVMSADALAFPDASFDLVLCQLGLMFVPDPALALAEMHRVLRPDGRLGIVVWSTDDKVPLFVPNRLLAALVPLSPIDQRLPTPTALGTPGLIEALVADAGFRHIAVDHPVVDFAMDEPERVWEGMTAAALPPIDAALAALTAERRAALHDEMIAFLESHRHGGEIILANEAIIVVARR